MERLYGENSENWGCLDSSSSFLEEATETGGDTGASHPMLTPPTSQNHHQRLSYSSPHYPPHTLFPQSYMHHTTAPQSTEGMLSTLQESQNRVFNLVESVSKRLGRLENVVADLCTKTNESGGVISSSSPEEKNRLPSSLSVSQ